MSWFPKFLNIWPAILAAAVAIPALLVLYFQKLKRREMPVSSTLLWKKAIQDLQVNAPFQKLRRNLLLLLQMLLLILLLLALSRPVTNYRPGAGKTTVLLIDRSASMAAKDYNGKTRLDEAKRRAKDFVSTMDRHASAMVIAFDDRAEAVQQFTEDVNKLKQAIDSIQQTDRPTKLKLAYQLAEAQIAYIPEQNRSNQPLPDVWIYSDGRVSDAQDLSIRANLNYDMIGTPDVGNIAIVALSAKRNYENPTKVQVFARLADYGPKPVNAQVQLSVGITDPDHPEQDNWSVRSIADVSLLPERWTDEQRDKAEKEQGLVQKPSVEFNIDLATAATLKVEQMHKEGDALPDDDVAQVIVPPPKPLSVLLVTDGDYFMERLLNTPALKLKDPQVMSPSSYEAKPLDDLKFDVIIFDRGYFPKKLPPAGNFIYLGSVGPNLKIKPVQENGKNVILQDNGVLDWKRDHPILRGLSMGKIGIARSLKLDVPSESEVLVDGTKGPLVVLHREGRSTHLILAFDILDTDWPNGRPSFPVFWYNALQFLAVGSDLEIRQSLEPGASPTIPRADLLRAGANLKQVKLIGPDGTQTIPVLPTGEFALPALEKVGIYSTVPPIPQFERIAVNMLDPNESNVAPIEHAPGNPTITSVSTSTQKSRLELWWWIVACGALPLLLIEWWVYTRRVHL
jgi:hypothetical protein